MALLTVDICLGDGSDGRLDGCLIMFPSLITSWISRECVMNVQINIYDIYVISLFRVKREPRSAWCKHLRSTAIYSNPQTEQLGTRKLSQKDHLNMKKKTKNTSTPINFGFPQQNLHLTRTLPGPYQDLTIVVHPFPFQQLVLPKNRPPCPWWMWLLPPDAWMLRGCPKVLADLVNPWWFKHHKWWF